MLKPHGYRDYVKNDGSINSSRTKVQELQHLISTAAALCNCWEMIVIGAPAILASCPDSDLPTPEEVELYLDEESFRRLINGSVGAGTLFHQFHGYCASANNQVTGLPPGWHERLIPLKAGETTGLCLAPNDLATRLLATGQQADRNFVDALLRHQLIDDVFKGMMGT